MAIHRKRRRFSVGLLAASACLSTPAFPAGVPDFNGVWGKNNDGFPTPYVKRDGIDSFHVIDGINNAFLKPWTIEALTERANHASSGHIFPSPESACWPNGVPDVFNFRHIEILQTPAQVTIYYKNNNQTRTIYLNQKHSVPLRPSWYGESVGHFEGDTLVADTAGFLRRPEASIDDWGTPVTEGLHVVERYHYVAVATGEPPLRPPRGHTELDLDYKGRIIEATFTVTDPNIFKKPWSVTLHYRPVAAPDSAVLEESICPENNRDFGHLMPTAQSPDF